MIEVPIWMLLLWIVLGVEILAEVMR